MKNNNSAIIRRLISRSLRANKKRNVFIVIAITLTTLLLGSVFSIGMTMAESIKMEGIRISGTMAHAAVGYPTASQIEKLSKLDYVKAVGTGYNVAYIKNTPQMGNMNLSLYYFDNTDWEKLRSPAYTDIVGSYPQEENDIMVPIEVLKKMGIDHPSIGMEIPLTYYTQSGESDKLIDKNFRLSGWFTNYTFVSSQDAADIILVSKELSQEYGKTVEKNGSADVMFDNSSRTSEYITKLKQDLCLTENQPVVPVSLYSTDKNSSSSGLIAVISIIAFLIVTGYLLIYNVLYISVSRDVRFYGLLKTMGTTPKQIKHIVTGQILRLCLIGIPIGEIFALLFSLIVVPGFISKLGSTSTGAVVSFSPFIYLGAALFAFITALLGAFKPAKKAAGISPIEAQRFTGIKYRRKHAYKSTRGKPYIMAFRNIFRDRHRASVVLLSLFLGVTTFLTVTTLVYSMGIDNYIASKFDSDFILKNNTLTDYGTGTKQKFSDEFIRKIKSLPGFENLHTTTQEWVRLDYSSDEFGQYEADFCRQKGYNQNLTEDDIQRNFRGYIVGVDREFITKLSSTVKKSIDIDAFERGQFALVATDDPKLFSNVHELTLTSLRLNNSGKKSIPLGGFIPFSFSRGGGMAPTIFVSNTSMLKLCNEPIISELDINVSKGFDQQALNMLKQIMNGDNEITRTSKIEMQEELSNARMVLYALGDGIALVIALIGILNFINVMSVGIMVRKHELATLESVGMSRKQVKKLLITEGFGYAVITLLLVSTFGNLITYGIFTLFRQQVTFAVFTYPFIPVLLVSLAIIAICVITPELVYRSIYKSTIVDRLREAE